MTDPSHEDKMTPLVLARAGIGGVLMGLANLVPGISGGTMLLAAGIYPRFVRAIATLSTLRLRRDPILLLASVTTAAVLGIVLLAGPIKDLVVHHRWMMYSIFIGLTLGGLPVVCRLARPHERAVTFGAIGGFVAMAILAIVQTDAGASGFGGSNFVMLFLAGLAGASAMILPGVSGGYLLLVLGQYVPILSAIDAFKEALRASDYGAAMDPAIHVLLPVGLGVVCGIVAVSNLLRLLFARFEKATLGVLIGLLLGAVVGLWPFQQPLEPIVGETMLKGQVVTVEMMIDLEVEGWPTERFTPVAGQVAGAIGLMLAGFAVTTLIARLGRDED